MKDFIIIGFILCLSYNLSSQDNLKTKKLYIGAFCSLDYSYRILLNNKGAAKTVADARDTYEITKLAYTIGLDFLYKTSKQIAFSLGIDYSLKGEQTKNQSLTYGSPPRRGVVYNTSTTQLPTNIYIKYNITYIDIPLCINVYLSKKKIAPFISTGVSTNIFLFEKTVAHETYTDGHHSISSTSGCNGYYRVNPQFQFGAGIDIAFKKARLRVYPMGRISVLKVNSGAVNDYFYSLGLGISYLLQI